MAFSIVLLLVLVYASGGTHHRYQKSPKACGLPESTVIKDAATCAEAYKHASGKHADIEAKIASFKVGEPTCGYNHEEKVLYFAEESDTNSDERATLWEYVCDHGHQAIEVAPNNVLSIMIFSVFIASIAHIIEWAFPSGYKPPHTVVLYVLGMVFSAISYMLEKSYPDILYVRFVNTLFELDTFHLFMVFLPPLLFEDAAGSNWHVLMRVIPNCILVAGPGVAVNTAVTAFSIYYLFSNTGENGSTELSLLSCVLLGSILSATDPVAVIGTLHSLHAPDKLSTLIAGEALLNDGTAIVMFHIFFDAARGATEFTVPHALMMLARLALGGLAVGLLFSLALHICLTMTRKMFSMQAFLVFFFIYTSFFFAELSFIHVSGVIVEVTLGFYMAAAGKHCIDTDHQHDLHSIVGFIAGICNESIFVLTGIIGWRLTTQQASFSAFNPMEDFSHWWELGMLYFIIHASRGLTVSLLWPLILRSGYGLRPKEALIVIFGGLRGAVGLSLGVIVDMKKEEPALPDAIRARIAFHVSGITLTTLLINGVCIGKLYKALNIYKNADYHDALVTRSLTASELDVKRRVAADLKQNWFFHNCYTDIIERAAPDIRKKRQPVPVGSLVSEIIRQANKDSTSFSQRYNKKLKQTDSLHHLSILAKVQPVKSIQRQLTASNSIQLQKKVMTDEETIGEVYETITNGANARINLLFKRGAIGPNTYRGLLACLDHSEEAIAGELRPYGYLEHKETDSALRGLDKKPHMEQLNFALDIAWASLKEQLRGPTGMAALFASCSPANFQSTSPAVHAWRKVKSDVHLVLGFIFVFEQMLQELSVFIDFPKVRSKMSNILHSARAEYLPSIERNNRALFLIAEHILCMRYFILLKQEVLEEYVSRGAIRSTDYSKVNNEYLVPALNDLNNFVPSSEQVQGIKRKTRGILSWFSPQTRDCDTSGLRPRTSSLAISTEKSHVGGVQRRTVSGKRSRGTPTPPHKGRISSDEQDRLLRRSTYVADGEMPCSRRRRKSRS